jgi:hypothetical protein
MTSVAVAFVLAGFWLLFILLQPSMALREQIGLGALALGYIVAWYVPVWIKVGHVRSQNRLLRRCRALYILGSNALTSGDIATASAVLARIRRIEWLWKFGDSIAFRICLAVWAVVWAVVACVAVRFAALYIMNAVLPDKVPAGTTLASELGVAFVVSLTAPLHALMGYTETWKLSWELENCGDRLERDITSPRSLSTSRSRRRSRNHERLRPEQVFGLAPDFTMFELNAARRRLIREYHPDLWHHVSPDERRAREETLKLINAAYDELRQRRRQK